MSTSIISRIKNKKSYLKNLKIYSTDTIEESEEIFKTTINFKTEKPKDTKTQTVNTKINIFFPNTVKHRKTEVFSSRPVIYSNSNIKKIEKKQETPKLEIKKSRSHDLNQFNLMPDPIPEKKNIYGLDQSKMTVAESGKLRRERLKNPRDWSEIFKESDLRLLKNVKEKVLREKRLGLKRGIRSIMKGKGKWRDGYGGSLDKLSGREHSGIFYGDHSDYNNLSVNFRGKGKIAKSLDRKNSKVRINPLKIKNKNFSRIAEKIVLNRKASILEDSRKYPNVAFDHIQNRKCNEIIHNLKLKVEIDKEIYIRKKLKYSATSDIIIPDLVNSGPRPGLIRKANNKNKKISIRPKMGFEEGQEINKDFKEENEDFLQEKYLPKEKKNFVEKIRERLEGGWNGVGMRDYGSKGKEKFLEYGEIVKEVEDLDDWKVEKKLLEVKEDEIKF